MGSVLSLHTVYSLTKRKRAPEFPIRVSLSVCYFRILSCCAPRTGLRYGSCTITDVAGASDWFVRWRRGMSSRTDLGFDALISTQADRTLEATAKVAARYQATPGLRLEGGVGLHLVLAFSNTSRGVCNPKANVIKFPFRHKHPTIFHRSHCGHRVVPNFT